MPNQINRGISIDCPPINNFCLVVTNDSLHNELTVEIVNDTASKHYENSNPNYPGTTSHLSLHKAANHSWKSPPSSKKTSVSGSFKS